MHLLQVLGLSSFTRGLKEKLSFGFFSKAFTSAEKNYRIGDRKLLAIQLDLEEWRHLLEGARHPVTIGTNHNNLFYYLIGLKTSPTLTSTWIFADKNVEVDALSCSFDPTHLVTEPSSIWPATPVRICDIPPRNIFGPLKQR